jgi:hydrogenase/urease accessory protein HupE
MPTRLLCTVCLSAVAELAAAHPAPFSYLDLYLDVERVHGALVIHDFDAAHELGIEDPATLLASALDAARADRLVRIVDERLNITVDAMPAAFRWGPIEVLAERQSLRLVFDIESGKPGLVDIDAVLFPYDPVHQTFINIYEDGRLAHQAILDARVQRLTYYTGGAPGRWAVVRTFVQSGVHHIMIGPDHILFLLGLLLLGGSLWRLATIVTAFTIGHSITLSLAALGLVQVNPGIVEPAIALSIVVVGVDSLLMRNRAKTPAGPARDLRPWLAAAFGLIHGFGFAAVLLELGLPREALGWSLAAFNVGVEIGQLAIVVLMVALLAALRRYDVVFAERFALAGCLGVIGAGLYWFVQRVWFTAV